MSEEIQQNIEMIDIQVSIEELHVLQRSLSVYVNEYEGDADDMRNLKLAESMKKVFLPILVKVHHPSYVEVPDNGEHSE